MTFSPLSSTSAFCLFNWESWWMLMKPKHNENQPAVWVKCSNNKRFRVSKTTSTKSTLAIEAFLFHTALFITQKWRIWTRRSWSTTTFNSAGNSSSASLAPRLDLCNFSRSDAYLSFLLPVLCQQMAAGAARSKTLQLNTAALWWNNGGMKCLYMPHLEKKKDNDLQMHLIKKNTS